MIFQGNVLQRPHGTTKSARVGVQATRGPIGGADVCMPFPDPGVDNLPAGLLGVQCGISQGHCCPGTDADLLC